jgi:hypothetical protein
MIILKKIIPVLLCMAAGCLLFAAPIELSGGKLKLVLYPETGSFSLFELSNIGKNRYEPLFEDRNYSTTSWFSVLMNGKIFKLTKKAGRPIIAEQTPAGARFVFTLTDDFQVEQEFSFVKDAVSGIPNAVRISTRIENTSGKPANFALKALVDTILGESEGIHFSTDERKRISSETRIFPPRDPDTRLISQNKNSSFVFFLQDSNVTRSETVYISNWDRLNTLTWTPESIEGRSFNTIYSVNDSAFLAVWPEKTIKANEKIEVNILLGVSAESMPSTAVSTAARDPDSNKMLIQQLLDRIAEIEANPNTASDEELRKLNEALDIMLKEIKE